MMRSAPQSVSVCRGGRPYKIGDYPLRSVRGYTLYTTTQIVLPPSVAPFFNRFYSFSRCGIAVRLQAVRRRILVLDTSPNCPPSIAILLYDTHALPTAVWTRSCALHPARVFLHPPPVSLASVGLKTYAHADLRKRPFFLGYSGPPRYPTTAPPWAPFARSALTNAPRTSHVFFLFHPSALDSHLPSPTDELLLPAAACAYCVDSPHRRVAYALLLPAAALACLARLSLLRAGIADAGLAIRPLAGVHLLPLAWDGSIPAV
ncbi:hypothetical protein C8J57DRAFT_1718514 [Mycena rebaudengoi]|nr:hypothetical protein C8J57DRAFT_1718514 [Mycena rebaudengoi]